MANEFSDLDSAATHLLRRLLKGESVDAKPFIEVDSLAESLMSVRRKGYVVKTGRKLELTALGAALRPALISLDARILTDKREREAQAAMTARAKTNALQLYVVLLELVEASDSPALDSEDVEVSTKAHARSFAAYEAAEAIIATVKGGPQ